MGALVATGVFVATDDDSAPSTTTVVRSHRRMPRSPGDHGRSRRAGDLASIIAKVEPAVVAITTADTSGSDAGAGTGFVITADGYIVTNNHVAEGAAGSGSRSRTATRRSPGWWGGKTATDLAVLKVDGTNLASVELGDSDDVQVGDEVVAIGNALALDGGLSVTRGIISGLHREVPTTTGAVLIGMLQTDAAINFGNSGRAARRLRRARHRDQHCDREPAEYEQRRLRDPDLQRDSRARRLAARAGGGLPRRVDADDHARTGAGAVVAGDVKARSSRGSTSASAASDAGLRVGDVIVRIDGKPVNEASDVQAFVRSRRPGDPLDVVVLRDGEQRTLSAKLTERPAA